MNNIQYENIWADTERCKSCAIRELVLFSDLQESDFDKIHYPIDDFKLDSGSVIYEQNEEISYVYTVRSGMIKLVQYLPNGEYRIVRLLEQGDLLGIESLNHQATAHQAVAMNDVEICRIPHTVINVLHHDTPRLHNALISKWQDTISKADLWVTQLSTGKVKQRVARLFLYLAKNANNGADFFMPSCEDIASMLGITVESVSKVTAELKRKGVLTKLEKHRVSVNMNELKKLIS